MSDDAPMVYGKHGEFQMPQDIWDTATQIVEAMEALEDEPVFHECDRDEMLKTIIASALYAERSGMAKGPLS